MLLTIKLRTYHHMKFYSCSLKQNRKNCSLPTIIPYTSKLEIFSFVKYISILKGIKRHYIFGTLDITVKFKILIDSSRDLLQYLFSELSFTLLSLNFVVFCGMWTFNFFQNIAIFNNKWIFFLKLYMLIKVRV